MNLRRLAAAITMPAALFTAACGGDDSKRATTPARTTPRTQTIPRDDALVLPATVPRRSTGPAEPAAVQVIERWTRELREGRVGAAAREFALPSRFQNGTPVLQITQPIEREAINRSFSCGAKAVRFGAARDFTIVVFRLTERPGGDCGAGTGNLARSAIRVRGGKIIDWYRLPDEGEQQAPQVSAPPV